MAPAPILVRVVVVEEGEAWAGSSKPRTCPRRKQATFSSANGLKAPPIRLDNQAKPSFRDKKAFRACA
jgi:hypothetical protein